MFASVQKESLEHLLFLANSIVDRKSTQVLLQNIKITASNKEITISALSNDVSLFGRVDANVKTEGEFTVDARMAYEIIRDLPNDILTIQNPSGSRLELECQQIRFKVNGTSADEFPVISGVDLENPSEVEAQTLLEMIEKTSYAVSNDETRKNMVGVYVEALENGFGVGKDAIRFTATDGHRLAFIDRPVSGFELKKPILIPKKGITELKKALEKNDGTVKVSINENFFTVESKGVTIGIRLLDPNFPDYRKVIPYESQSTITCSRKDLADAIRRVNLVTTETFPGIKAKLLDSNFVVSSFSKEYGEAVESISVNQEGADVVVGFSGRYLLEILNTMNDSDTVKIKFNGPNSAVILNGTSDEFYNCVIMPMRYE